MNRTKIQVQPAVGDDWAGLLAVFSEPKVFPLAGSQVDWIRAGLRPIRVNLLNHPSEAGTRVIIVLAGDPGATRVLAPFRWIRFICNLTVLPCALNLLLLPVH